MNKTPKEILLEQHRHAAAKLDRVRDKVIADELGAGQARAAIIAGNDPVLRSHPTSFWRFFLQPGFAAIVLVAGAGFAAGWGMKSNTPTTTASTKPAAQNHPSSPRIAANHSTGNKTFEQILAETDGYMRNEHIRDFVSQLNPTQTRDLLTQLQKNPRKGEYYEAHQTLVAHLTELDPQGAIAWAQGLPKPNDRMEALRNVFEAWGQNDPKLLLGVINQTTNLNQRRDLQQMFVNNLASQNPVEALAYLNGLPAGQRQPYVYAQVFQQWAQTDPAAAAAAAAALPAGQMRNQALESLAQGWAQKDPQGALAWAQTLPSGSARNDAMSNIMNNLANQDPQAAIKLLDDLPNNNLRVNLINTIANSLAQNDPAAALAWARNADIPAAVMQNVIPNILSQVAQSDPAAAAQYADTLPTGPLRQNAISNIASIWAENDVQGALAWADSLAPADLTANSRRNVYSNILSNWAGQDPAAAANYLNDHLTDRTFTNSIQNIASQWAETDPTAALAWAQSLPDSNNKTNALSNILSQQANQDPQAVWNYLQDLPPGTSNARMQGVMQSVISSWAQEDPAQTAQIVASLPEGNQAKQAYTTLASEWLNQDPYAASQWIATLPSSPERDSAVSQMVSTQSMYEPDTTFAWALTIDNDQMRQNDLRIAATELYRTNPQQAEQIISASGLPGDQAAALLQQAQNGVNGGGRGGPIRPGVMYKGGPAVMMMAPNGVSMDSAPMDAPVPMTFSSAVNSDGTVDSSGSAVALDMSSPALAPLPPDGGAKIMPTTPRAMAPAAPMSAPAPNGSMRIGKPLLVPPPAKAPTIAKTPTPAASPVSSLTLTYTIVAGDTLSSIARKNGVTLADLQNDNPGIDPTKLKIGQVINLPQYENASSGTNPSAPVAPTAPMTAPAAPAQ